MNISSYLYIYYMCMIIILITHHNDNLIIPTTVVRPRTQAMPLSGLLVVLVHRTVVGPSSIWD